MKNIKMRLITWIGLLAVCLLPIGARAEQHFLSGIIGLVDATNAWNTIAVSEGRRTIWVPIDVDGSFKVDLKPGSYVLTPYLIPVYVPGQPFPNLIGFGTSIRVMVTRHRFTFVEIPVLRLLPSAPIGYQPFRINGGT
jgi:hypothetical protein